jgi:5,10-methylene-tetrahydrofolate dehydrogenase/methenyl tetrahydrofolate cyclohydrolase
LPKHINEERVLGEISIEKDVDGFHPLNIGKLAMKGRESLFVPCTPKVFIVFSSEPTFVPCLIFKISIYISKNYEVFDSVRQGAVFVIFPSVLIFIFANFMLIYLEIFYFSFFT